MARSLPAVSAKVVADIEQFVSEFKRAENVTRRTSDYIDRELTDLAKRTKAKFSLGDVGKDILKGAGLFGGFQIAETAASKIVDYFRKEAEFSTDVEESMEKQLKVTKEMIALRQTDLQKLNSMRTEFARLAREIQDAEGKEQTEEQRKHVLALRDAYAQLGLEIATAETARKKQTEDEVDALVKQREDVDKRVNQGLGSKFSVGLSRGDLIAGLKQRQGQLLFDRSQLVGQMDVESLKKYNALSEELALVSKNLGMLLEKNAQLGRDVGGAFAASMEDAIFSGEKLSDVLKNLAQDLLRLAFRESIGNPLASGVAAGFGKIMESVGMRAAGGPVSGGKPYIVGEEGPELFVPGASGAIVPNDALGGGSRGGAPARAGDTYIIDARGADRTGLARLEAMIRGLNGSIESRSLAAVANSAMRGGGFKRAFV